MPPATVRNLTERRVPQYLAIYLGASWGLVQFIDFLTSRYGLSPRWTDLTLLAVALLLPSVVLYIYNHGAPGRDEWQRSEKLFIPVNIVLLAGVLTFVGAGSNLSAVTTRVHVKDEKGNTIEAVVPNKAYRKRVAMYLFDVAPSAASSQWLKLGLPFMVMQDLRQQQFVEIVPHMVLREKLRQAGYEAGLNVPLALKRKVANEMHIPHFISGTIEKTAGGVTAHVQVYETSSAKLIAERTFTAPTAAAVSDLISAQLLKDLDIPVLTDAKPDLPLTELLTNNPRALDLYLQAQDAIWTRDEWANGKRGFDEAAKLDPTFAAAHNMRYVTALYTNQPQDGPAAIQAAMDHAYKLPDRDQQFLKANYYMAKQDFQRAYAVLDMMAQLYPEDLEVIQLQVLIDRARGNKDVLIRNMKKVLALDPSRAEFIQQLGEIYEEKGDVTAALEQYEAYAKRFPNEAVSHLKIGALYSNTGQHAKARAALEKALLNNPADVPTLVEMARLDRNLGNFETAHKRLEEAVAVSKTPNDKSLALDALGDLYEFTGRIDRSIATAHSAVAEAAKFQPPAYVLVSRLQIPALQASVDRGKALSQLASLTAQLQPPWDILKPFAEVKVYDALNDADREEAAVAGLEQMIEKTTYAALRPTALRARGRVMELRGNCVAALQFFEQQKKSTPLEIGPLRDIGRCQRKLGHFKESEAALNGVLRVIPSDGRANLELALLHTANGDGARAKVHADRARTTWKDADAGYAFLKELPRL